MSFTGHFLATAEIRVNFNDQQTRHHEWQLYLKYIAEIHLQYLTEPQLPTLFSILHSTATTEVLQETNFLKLPP